MKLYFSFDPPELSSPQLRVVRLSRARSSNLKLMVASPGDDEDVLLRKKEYNGVILEHIQDTYRRYFNLRILEYQIEGQIEKR